MSLPERADEEIAEQILDTIGPVIELGDRVKRAAKRIRCGKLSYYLDDFDTMSFYIMCDFAESILEKIAPALEDGCNL